VAKSKISLGEFLLIIILLFGRMSKLFARVFISSPIPFLAADSEKRIISQ